MATGRPVGGPGSLVVVALAQLITSAANSIAKRKVRSVKSDVSNASVKSEKVNLVLKVRK